MLLDHAGPAGERQDFLIAEHKGRALGKRGQHIFCRAFAVSSIDQLVRFAATALLHDRHQFRIGKQRLVDLVLVRIDYALHDVLAQTPSGVDQHYLFESGLRVDGKHHTCAAEVSAHHRLHADRQGHLAVIETLRDTVGDRPIGEQ